MVSASKLPFCGCGVQSLSVSSRYLLGVFVVMDTFNKYRSGGEEETEHENCDLTSMILILWEVYCFDMVEMEKEEGARFVVEVKHYLVKFDF